MKKYDFCGYATRNDLQCSDGRTIRRDAFKECDGETVPLIWNHRHDDPEMVIGHALLENRNDGVFAYCFLNDTDRGQACKKIIKNKDVKGLSIFANQLKQRAGDVLHGVIREVSLVLAGANPGAHIDFALSHSDESTGEMYAYLVGNEFTEIDYGEEDMGYRSSLRHADDDEEEVKKPKRRPVDDDDDDDDGEGKTVKEVFDTLTPIQKNAVYAVIGAAMEDANGGDDDDDDEEEENPRMRHSNIFENDYKDDGAYISHSDQQDILAYAKQPGYSFKTAFGEYLDANNLQHDAVTGISGFLQTNADGNVTWMFPEYKDVRPGAPELITNDQGWVGTVLAKVNKSPITRVRTSYVDIRNIDSLRAKGYQKGDKKLPVGNYNVVRRTHDPQTIQVMSALHRDDVVDITDFSYIDYQYKIDRMNLNEELATAIMLGDGRDNADPYKIFPEHIRPIWTDDEMYTMHVDVDVEAARASLQGTDTGSYFGDNYVLAESVIEAALFAREDFRGTGTPDLFINQHTLNVMLLSRDRNGRRIFSDKNELAAALNVGSVYTVEQFANKVRTDSDNHKHKLLAIMVNLSDYTVGHTKGGEITHFTDFDIDFNQLKSLLETRLSGALTRIYSAIVLEQPTT